VTIGLRFIYGPVILIGRAIQNRDADCTLRCRDL